MTSLRYVPALLLDRVADGAASAGPRADACDGVLLFADITGFTELMVRQTDLGRAGMEAFASALNGYFGELIERVATAGGDVVSFAGDALLAMWPCSEDTSSGLSPLELPLCAALACANDIQRDLNRRDVGGGVRLSTRITITAGRASLIHVGGFKDRWEFFVAGEVTDQIGPALRKASPGQVVLSDEAAAVIGPASKNLPPDELPPGSRRSFGPFSGADDGPPASGRVSNPPASGRASNPPASGRITNPTVTRASDGPPTSHISDTPPPTRTSSNPPASRRSSPGGAPSGPVDEAALQSYVPQVVQFWVGRERFLGEVRTVSTCFVNLPRVDLDAPNALARMNARLRTIQEIVDRYEGVINKVFADEKGLAVVLAWGLPTMSHEDDASRAVHAARAIHEALKTDSSAPSVGIATGAVYCGLIGNERRGEYTILGNTVNIAARLMQAARGGVLCDSSTVQDARASFMFSPPAPRSLKGIVRPILASTPLGLRAGRDSRPPAACIGRDAEIAEIAERLVTASAEGRGSIVMVEADAGMGKSTLLSAVMSKARAATFRVLFGEAQAVERRVAYHPFRTVVADLLGVRYPADVAEIPRAIAAAVGGDAWFEERAPLLNTILPVTLPDTPFVTELTSDQARTDNLHALIVRLLDNVAARMPVALVLDDLHWFDSTSWTLLGALIRSLPQVLFVLGTRPLSGQGATEYEVLRNNQATLTILLSGLDNAGISEMVARELGVASLPAALQSMLTLRSEGNPFYALELALTLRDQGMLVVEDKRCKITTPNGDIDTGVLPGTIQGLVRARLDKLAADEQLFLKVASVIGRAFDLADVEAIMPERDADVAAIARRLSTADMLRSTDGPAGTLLEFRHTLARDAIYDSMLLTQRRELHGSVVGLLEGRRASASRSSDLLAHHASRAEDWPRAIKYLVLASMDALSRSANAECRQHVEHALTIVSERNVDVPEGQLADWHWCASMAAFRMGSMDACIAHARSALIGYHQPLPKRAIGSLSEIAVAALWRSRRGRSGATYGAELPPSIRERVLDLYHCLVDAFGYKQDVAGLLTSVMRQMDLAETAGNAGLAGHARLMLYFVLALTPFASRVRGWVAECEALLEKPMDARVRASLLSRLCAAHAYMAEWDDAERCSSEGVRLAWEIGDMRAFTEAAINASYLMHTQGRYQESEPLQRRVFEVTRLTGDRQFQALSAVYLAESAARRGDGAAHRSKIDDLEAWIEASVVGADYVCAQGTRAFVTLLSGDAAAALKLADLCVARAAKEPLPVGWMLQGLCGAGDVYDLLAEDAARRGSKEAHVLRSKLDKLTAQLRRHAKVYRCTELFLGYYEGRALALAGKAEKAQKVWRAALAGSTAAGTHYVRARTLIALGRSLGDGSTEGASAIEEGEETLRELEAIVPALPEPFITTGEHA